MKQIFFLTALVLCIAITKAQDPKLIFTSQKIIYYGLDFSKAKFELPDAKPDELKNTLIPYWNSLTFTDNEQFNKESTFQKLTVYGEPVDVARRNAAINTGTLMGKSAGPLSREAIQEIVNDYKDGSRKEGIGVAIIVESFSKKDDAGVEDIVFFDIATHKVLLFKHLTGKPGGPGLKNYWTTPTKRIFEDIGKGLFDIWKKEVTK